MHKHTCKDCGREFVGDDTTAEMILRQYCQHRCPKLVERLESSPTSLELGRKEGVPFRSKPWE